MQVHLSLGLSSKAKGQICCSVFVLPSLTLSLSLSILLSCSPSLVSLSPPYLPLFPFVSLSHSLSLSLSFFHSLSLCLPLTLPLFLSLSLTLSFPLSPSLTPSLSLPPCVFS